MGEPQRPGQPRPLGNPGSRGGRQSDTGGQPRARSGAPARHPVRQRDRVLRVPCRRPDPAHRLRHPWQDDHLGAARPHPRTGRHGTGVPPRLDVARPRRHLATWHRALCLRRGRVHLGAVGPAAEVRPHPSPRRMRDAPRARPSRRVCEPRGIPGAVRRARLDHAGGRRARAVRRRSRMPGAPRRSHECYGHLWHKAGE